MVERYVQKTLAGMPASALIGIMWCWATVRAFPLPRPHPQRHITSNATEEIKLDGYRAVAFKSRDDVKLFAKTSIPVRGCIMDLNTV
jgi:hypothetical protein